ncbi:MAG TPA: RNA methyltransferase [Desulfobacteraceae bacterium]|nr:RNA methyltransferase [Desulfobacteraceae bacterium]
MAADRTTVRLDVALIHYPVVNRSGEIIGSAVTNLDLHDIARAGCTYGVDTYWVVTPFARQRELAEEIVRHWTEGYGGSVNPDRKQALSLIRVCADLDEVLAGTARKWGRKPLVLATCARRQQNTLSYAAVRQQVHQGEPLLLLFGTAWGLAPAALAAVAATLPPLRGGGEFNHLSVRSAVAVILDRLLAIPAEPAESRPGSR